MDFKAIDHIAIAVSDLESALRTYEALFGIPASHREYIEAFGAEVATIPFGETAIELIEGKTETSPIRKFVEQRGPGLHHVAYRVADIRSVLADLRDKGVRLIDEKPRAGKENSLVAFVHPKATGGVLYELVQPASD